MASYPVPDLSPLRKDPETSLSLEESVIIYQGDWALEKGHYPSFFVGVGGIVVIPRPEMPSRSTFTTGATGHQVIESQLEFI